MDFLIADSVGGGSGGSITDKMAKLFIFHSLESSDCTVKSTLKMIFEWNMNQIIPKLNNSKTIESYWRSLGARLCNSIFSWNSTLEKCVKRIEIEGNDLNWYVQQIMSKKLDTGMVSGTLLPSTVWVYLLVWYVFEKFLV